MLLQPYLGAVDRDGETALIYFHGQFSHAICKHALLARGVAPTRALFAPERIEARTPGADELQLGEAALRVIAAHADLGGAAPPYARVDVLRDADGVPHLLELEMAEPSLFLAFSQGAADRCATAIARLLEN